MENSPILDSQFSILDAQFAKLGCTRDNTRRVHCCIFHFDIKDGKIWLQENNTDIEIDEDLEEMGISKKEIVVGFHHPSMRQYSKYAVS